MDLKRRVTESGAASIGLIKCCTGYKAAEESVVSFSHDTLSAKSDRDDRKQLQWGRIATASSVPVFARLFRNVLYYLSIINLRLSIQPVSETDPEDLIWLVYWTG